MRFVRPTRPTRAVNFNFFAGKFLLLEAVWESELKRIENCVGDPSVTFWCGLKDPDPTPLFSDFKLAKNIFFSYNLPAGPLSSVLEMKYFAKILLKFYFRSIISVLSTLMRKGKDPEPSPDPYL